MDDLTDLAEEFLDDAAEWRRQLNDRFRRLDLDDRLVDCDGVTRRNQPRDDLRLGETFAQVRE